MKIKTFTFNPIQVNTFVVYDESNECIIIDPACYFEDEFKILDSFIKENSLIPKYAVASHFHFDHLMGAAEVWSKYNIPLAGHKNYSLLWEIGMTEQARSFGFDMKQPPLPSVLFEHGSVLSIANTTFNIIHLPGHSPCGIALYNKDASALFCGDVLFEMSIGRTDLPGGNYDQLIESIKKQLFTLPPYTIVYPGHGDSTTIMREMKGNPFF